MEGFLAEKFNKDSRRRNRGEICQEVIVEKNVFLSKTIDSII